ncbi:MAG: glycosyltransferase, partial [Elusimicrobia bacterium]|nr:glycosyltransferase [Elusimicrobiota bacterium]
MTLAAAVINRDGLRYLPGCLAALAATPVPFGRLIFVDDASCDGSADWVERNYPDVRVIRLPRREGAAAARNAAIAAAGGGLLLLLDCDASISGGCVQELRKELTAHGAVLALPRVLLPSGVSQHGGGRMHFLGFTIFDEAWGAAPAAGGGPRCACGATALLLDL